MYRGLGEARSVSGEADAQALTQGDEGNQAVGESMRRRQ